MAKMVVLGNGFDLSSKLKSSYRDFMDYRIPQEKKDTLDSFYESTFNISSNNGSKNISRLVFKNSEALHDCQPIPLNSKENIEELTCWDIFLYYKYNQNDDIDKNDKTIPWYNIEEDILNFISIQDKDAAPYVVDFSTLFKKICIRTLNNYPNKTLQRATLVCNALLYNLRLGNDYSNKLPLSFLHDELIEFERAFKEYIFYQSQQNDYRTSSIDLFYKIAGGGREEFYILNFNYTVPLSNLYNVKHRNIHGNIDSNVIFGVDTKNFTPHEEQYVFTKTYRLLTEKEFSSPAPLPSNLDSIVFFGHSLKYKARICL